MLINFIIATKKKHHIKCDASKIIFIRISLKMRGKNTSFSKPNYSFCISGKKYCIISNKI